MPPFSYVFSSTLLPDSIPVVQGSLQGALGERTTVRVRIKAPHDYEHEQKAHSSRAISITKQRRIRRCVIPPVADLPIKKQSSGFVSSLLPATTNMPTPAFLSPIFESGLDSTTALVAAAAVLVLVGFVSVLYTAERTKYKKKYATPWPKVEGGLPFLGNTHQLKHPKFLVKMTEQWAGEYSKEHGCYEVNIMGVRYVVACNEDRMKEIMMKRPIKVVRSPQITRAALSVKGDGIFTAEGAEWQKQRKIVAPMLNNNHIRDYLDHIKLIGKRLASKWSKKDPKTLAEGFGINDDMFNAAMDISGCLLYTSPSPRDQRGSRMPSSA